MIPANMAEVDQKGQICKKISSLRKVPKVEKDAKEIALGIKSKKVDNPCDCKACKESGALIHCSQCQTSYHLGCAKIKEKDIPYGNWYCNKCIPICEKKMKDEYGKHEKLEKNAKNGKVKEALSILNNFEKDKVVMKFGKKYPQFVKQGKINYPIEDFLLISNPDFHQVTINSLPIPKPSTFPQESFLDLISITAFVYTFSQHIGVSPFTLDLLYTDLSQTEESNLIKELIMALTKELILQILSKENLEEQLSGYSRYLYSSSKLSSIFNILDFLPYSWLTLFSEIMTSNAFKDYTEDTVMESIIIKAEESPIEVDFFKYTLDEKVACITFLISCFCDTKIFHEELSERIDKKTALSREKALIKAGIKEIEQKQAAEAKNPQPNTRKISTASEKIQKLQQKIQDLSHKIEDIQVRITPLGLDRHFNEYYFFKFDPTKLYMLKPLENTWHYFDPKDIESLQSCLNPKGLRESKLIENLKLKKNNFKAEGSNLDDYNNKLSAFKDLKGDVQTCKKMLMDLEKKFSKYLQKSDKQWETDENQEKWKTFVMRAENVQDFADLLLEHYEKSSTPLRQTITDSFSDNSEEAEYEKKYRKVSIRIWQDFGDHNTIWVEQVKAATNIQQIILSIGIYSAVLENYVKKKYENMKNEEKKKPKDEKKKKDGKKTTNGVKHEDNCFFCDDGGELICCEGCTRVVHPECIGFEKVPEDDWFCDACNKTGVRVTRSKSRLRKLNS